MLAGLLQQLPLPSAIWKKIGIDFIDGLPISHRKSTIVVVDKMSTYTHFIALSDPCTALPVAQIFMDHIYKLHGLPKTIIANKDRIFVSKFWGELFKLQS